VWLIQTADERVGVQVKLWKPLRTRAIPERFCGGDSLRRGAISSVCTFTFTFTHPATAGGCDSAFSSNGDSVCLINVYIIVIAVVVVVYYHHTADTVNSFRLVLVLESSCVKNTHDTTARFQRLRCNLNNIIRAIKATKQINRSLAIIRKLSCT